MTDIHYEQLISRRKSPMQTVYRVLVYAAIILLVLSSVLIGYLGLALALVWGIVASYLILPRFYVEYEYNLFNKNLDIDVIYQKSKRKPALQLELSSAELIAPLSSPRIMPYKTLPKLNFSEHDPDKEPYAIICSHGKSKICVLIQMRDDLYSHLKMVVPRVLYHD